MKSIICLIFLVGLTQAFPKLSNQDIGIDRKTLNNYPGFTIPRPFAAFHPTGIIEILKEMAKIQEEDEQPVYPQPSKPFSPMNFRIIVTHTFLSILFLYLISAKV